MDKFNWASVEVEVLDDTASRDARATKAETEYEPKAANPNNRCSLCEYFSEPRGCEKVQGDISPEGWCNLFERELEKYNDNHDEQGRFASGDSGGDSTRRGKNPPPPIHPITEEERKQFWTPPSALANHSYDTTKSERIEKQIDHAFHGLIKPSQYKDLNLQEARHIYIHLAGAESWDKEMENFDADPHGTLTYLAEGIYGEHQRKFIAALHTSAEKLALKKYNENHDPSTGQFSTSGGSYRKVKKSAERGDEVHHMPSYQATEVTSPLKFDFAPAIKMPKADHILTASYGNKAPAIAYRNRQKELMKQGKYAEAQQMDIDDLRAKFGDKYEKHIKELQDYTNKLPTHKYSGNRSNPTPKMIRAKLA